MITQTSEEQRLKAELSISNIKSSSGPVGTKRTRFDGDALFRALEQLDDGQLDFPTIEWEAYSSDGDWLAPNRTQESTFTPSLASSPLGSENTSCVATPKSNKPLSRSLSFVSLKSLIARPMKQIGESEKDAWCPDMEFDPMWTLP